MADDADPRRFFEAEVLRLMDRMFGTALRLTRNPADAEDLVAEAMAKAWAALPSLRERERFEKWLFCILANTFVSDRRRFLAGRGREISAADATGDGEHEFSLFEQLHQPFLLWWGNPEQELLNKLLREDLQNALDALPAEFRCVVMLIDVHGCSYAEAANALGVPVGTVRSRLNRGRGIMQRILWETAKERGLAGAVGGANRERP